MNIDLMKKSIEEILKILEGFEGESKIRDFLTTKKIKYFQVDLIALCKEKYILIEVKNQEKFEAPPYDGHGLPSWQVEARLEFYKATNIEPFLFVIEKNTNHLYWQSFIKLEEGEHFDTSGAKPRRVYPLTSFNQRDF